MASQDLRSNLKILPGASGPLAASGIIFGPIIDTKGFESATFFTLIPPTTAGIISVFITDGDDPSMSDEASVDQKFIIGGGPTNNFPPSAVLQISSLGYVGHKRFVRISVIADVSVLPSPVQISGVVALSHAHDNPPS